MKKPLFLVLLLCAVSLRAQTPDGAMDYRRNAIATMMVFHSEDEFGGEIYNAFASIPVPDKYDDHNVDMRVVSNDSICGVQKQRVGLSATMGDLAENALNSVQKQRTGLIKAEYGKVLSKAEVLKNAQALEDYLNNFQCAKLMVAKWFRLPLFHDDSLRRDNMSFSTELIQQRGQYNATDVDVNLALQSARGLAMLSDAGEELLGNTFMLVNDITYVTAEEQAAVAKAVVGVLGAVFDAFTGGNTGENISNLTNDIADSYTGFKVKTHSYLYQLDWNDSVAAVFYNNYYTETAEPDKLMAFLRDTVTFRMKYVAHEYEYDGKSALVGTYTREELVRMACTRSMDKNIAALQAQYEDFKVKTPVYSVLTNGNGRPVGYTAKIGMKEGITEKSKFQAVQRIFNPETQRTTYRYVATLKPVKGQVWDNRYNAVTEKAEGSDLTYTTFKKLSGGEVLPGMLIIEGKYRKVQE